MQFYFFLFKRYIQFFRLDWLGIITLAKENTLQFRTLKMQIGDKSVTDLVCIFSQHMIISSRPACVNLCFHPPPPSLQTSLKEKSLDHLRLLTKIAHNLLITSQMCFYLKKKHHGIIWFIDYFLFKDHLVCSGMFSD